jgi:hypothetical protein
MTSTNEKIDMTEILKSASADNKLSCAKTFEIINKYSFFPDIAGLTMTQNKIKITFCQLGLFGYPEGKIIPSCDNVSDELEDKIYSGLEDGKLPCGAAWNIANVMKIKKIDVSAACEKLGIKINKCQLGAF